MKKVLVVSPPIGRGDIRLTRYSIRVRIWNWHYLGDIGFNWLLWPVILVSALRLKAKVFLSASVIAKLFFFFFLPKSKVQEVIRIYKCENKAIETNKQTSSRFLAILLYSNSHSLISSHNLTASLIVLVPVLYCQRIIKQFGLEDALKDHLV